MLSLFGRRALPWLAAKAVDDLEPPAIAGGRNIAPHGALRASQNMRESVFNHSAQTSGKRETRLGNSMSTHWCRDVPLARSIATR